MSSLLLKKLDKAYLCTMSNKTPKTADYVASVVQRMPRGYVFTYEDFMGEVEKKEAVIKALNRLAASGKIAKLAKGKYYKPEETAFGQLQPDQYQVVKDLLEEDGKVIGYLTGYSIYNQLGLNTQVSNTIQIGSKDTRPKFQRGRFTISFVKQKNNITRENIPLLQILDAMRYIKNIPDTTPEAATKRFKTIIKDLSEKGIASIVRLAQKYPPSTRALLGAILEEIGQTSFTSNLKESLNPITQYEVPGMKKVLSTAENWNLK